MWKFLLVIPALLVIGILILPLWVPMTPGILFNSLFGASIDAPTEMTRKARLQLPPGFSFGIYAQDLPGVRFMAFSKPLSAPLAVPFSEPLAAPFSEPLAAPFSKPLSKSSNLVVARPKDGKVMLIRDTNGDGIADNIETLIENLSRPHSVDFYADWLYIAESNAIGRIRFEHATGMTQGKYEHIITGLGDGGNHWSKTIRFGADGFLYLSAGSTCNVCLQEDPLRAAITRYRPDGSGEQRVATGLRNSVGMDWAPFDQQLYATDNGRDLLGDDYPPCELNQIKMGGFYGWPFVNGTGDLDPDLGDATKLPGAISPVHEFRAHNAPLGIHFIRHQAWQDDYKDAALVALHGSWNRSTHDGYKVVSLHRREDGGFDERDFFAGFELAGDVIGRPVDIAMGADDCAYISDDYAGTIYRVCYGEEALPSNGMSSMDKQGMDKQGMNKQGKTGMHTTNTGLEDIPPARLASLKARGEALYMRRGCQACHTLAAKDKSGLKPLANLRSKYTVDSLAAYYKTPTPPMPPLLLNDEDRLAMSAWLLGL